MSPEIISQLGVDKFNQPAQRPDLRNTQNLWTDPLTLTQV